jgi:transposase
MNEHNIVCAGIDTGKRKLDVALDGRRERLQVDNIPDGHRRLSEWLRQYHTMRVGIEASGGYEQAVVAQLRRDGFVVIMFQPAQVRAYAKFHLQLAKNDKIDAALIAACTAAARKIHAPPDPRLAPFAEHLTLIEQITDDIARIRTRRESCRDPRVQGLWKEEIARLNGLIKVELKQLVAAIRQHPDLAERLDLIASVDGVGLRTAVAILVRMPEIGHLSREQAAALAGLAPTTATAAMRSECATSKEAVSVCAQASTTQDSRQPSIGTINSRPPINASSQPENRIRLLSSLAPESSSSL